MVNLDLSVAVVKIYENKGRVTNPFLTLEGEAALKLKEKFGYGENDNTYIIIALENGGDRVYICFWNGEATIGTGIIFNP